MIIFALIQKILMCDDNKMTTTFSLSLKKATARTKKNSLREVRENENKE
jgi:hypothetical protein